MALSNGRPWISSHACKRMGVDIHELTRMLAHLHWFPRMSLDPNAGDELRSFGTFCSVAAVAAGLEAGIQTMF
jgi:hypothetical protein